MAVTVNATRKCDIGYHRIADSALKNVVALRFANEHYNVVVIMMSSPQASRERLILWPICNATPRARLKYIEISFHRQPSGRARIEAPAAGTLPLIDMMRCLASLTHDNRSASWRRMVTYLLY